MSIVDEKYVSFTTYKRDGTPVGLPVWIADRGDGTWGFTTGSDSWKVKRLANNDACTLQPCDSRGKVKAGSEIVSGTARRATETEVDEVRKLIAAKYPIGFRLISLSYKVKGLFGKSEGSGDAAIVVTPES